MAGISDMAIKARYAPNKYLYTGKELQNHEFSDGSGLEAFMAGDQFSIRVSSWYQLNGTTPGTPVNPLTDILAHLIAGMAGVPNPENPGLAALQTNSPIISPNVLQFLSDTGSNINNSIPVSLRASTSF